MGKGGVGVGYGKGASLPEEQVRWVTGEEVERRRGAGERVRCFDCRGEEEYRRSTVPDAELLSQAQLMFQREALQPLVDELCAPGSADELVFFANTAGPVGIAAGRDVYVMAFLAECGLPLERMARLTGGLNAWKAERRPCVARPAGGAVTAAASAGLDALLAQLELPHLAEPLASTSLAELGSARPRSAEISRDQPVTIPPKHPNPGSAARNRGQASDARAAEGGRGGQARRATGAVQRGGEGKASVRGGGGSICGSGERNGRYGAKNRREVINSNTHAPRYAIE